MAKKKLKEIIDDNYEEAKDWASKAGGLTQPTGINGKESSRTGLGHKGIADMDQYPLIPLSAIQPHPENYNKHPEAQIRHLAASIRKHGFFKPIVISQDGYIIAGHGTTEAAESIGVTQIPYVQINVDHDDPRAIEILVTDNESSKGAYGDPRELNKLLERISESGGLLGTGHDEESMLELLNTINPEDGEGEPSDGMGGDSYVRKIEPPTYKPTGPKPDMVDLYNDVKKDQLIIEIEKSALPEEEKEFLRMAAHRHIVFNYQQIAEYYSHSGPAVQELMEKSGLVVIDLNSAIEYGFVAISKDLLTLAGIETGDTI